MAWVLVAELVHEGFFSVELDDGKAFRFLMVPGAFFFNLM